MKTALSPVGEQSGRTSLLYKAVSASPGDTTEKHITKPPGFWFWCFCLLPGGLSLWLCLAPSPSQRLVRSSLQSWAAAGHPGAFLLSTFLPAPYLAGVKPRGLWGGGKAWMGFVVSFISLLPEEPGSWLPPRAEPGLGSAS